MQITSIIFFIFLFAVFLCYHSVGSNRAQNLVLVIASFIFYSCWDYRFCLLLLGTSVVDFVAGWKIYHSEKPVPRKYWLAASLIYNLGTLGFFKYFDFFIGSFISFAGVLGFSLSKWSLNIILPIGVSFFTFSSLTYTIEIFRGRRAPTGDYVAYLTFISFFPKLAAGPIERADTLLPQLMTRRSFDYAEATEGLRLILWGLFKKMVLADNLALIVNSVYDVNLAAQGGPQLAAATVCFAFQIYYDFSGYSDIAMGSARLFNIRLMQNFAYPYFSQSPAEFWRRWHISLTSWFRDYVFIPLGGSRRGTGRKILNVMITFLVSGLWHGASGHFIFWGGVNGIGILPQTILPVKRKLRASDVPGAESVLPGPLAILKMFFTFVFICMTWVFFRASSLGDAVFILCRIPDKIWTFRWYYEALSLLNVYRMTIWILLIFLVAEWVCRRNLHALKLKKLSGPARWLVYTFLFWLILWQTTNSQGQFVYFRF